MKVPFLRLTMLGAGLLSAALPVLGEEDFLDLSLGQLASVEVSIASPFAERMLQASSSVSVVQRSEWLLRSDRNLFDVLSHLPSVMTYQTIGSEAIALRGFAQNSSIRGMATLLDGVPLNNLAFGTAQYDKADLALATLDRVELMRGPGSALYGSDAFNGAVSLSSYRGRRDHAEVEVGVASDGYQRLGARGSLGLGEQWRLSGSLGGNNQQSLNIHYDYLDPVTAEPGRGNYDYRYDNQSLSLNLESEWIADWRFGAGIYLNDHQTDDMPGIGRTISGGGSWLRDRDHMDLDSEFEMARAELAHRWQNGVQMTVSQFYWQSRFDHRLDGNRFPLIGGVQMTRDNEHRRGSKLEFQQKSEVLQTDWVVSFSYDKMSIDRKTKETVNDQGVTLFAEQPEASQGQYRATKGVVLQAKSYFADRRWTLLYGGRIDRYSDVGTQRTPRLGVIYQPTPDQAVKLLYGNAFRAPTAVELYGIAVAKGNRQLEPETIDTYELSYLVQRDNWHFEAVLFQSEWQNAIILQPCQLGSPCVNEGFSGEYRNVNDNLSRGVELVAEWLHDRWQLKGNLSFVDSRNQTAKYDYDAFPNWIINLEAAYRWPQQRVTLQLNNRILLGMDEGPRVDDLNHYATLPTYWRTDLTVAKRFLTESQLYLKINNLVDRDNDMPSLWNTENGFESPGLSVELGVHHAL